MTIDSKEGHLDPTAEITLETVKNRTVRGVVVLTGRTFILQIITFVAQGFLWAYLTPGQFGVFFIVSAIINFLTYFSDIGLAAALIQKKEKPSESDFNSTFLIQQILVVSLIAIVMIMSPLLVLNYSLSYEGKILLYALAFSFFLASLKSIPSVLLERKLEFGKLVIPQVLEQLVYNITLVIFAIKGLGITSFTYAVLIRGFVGLVAIYILQPWKPGIVFSRRSLSGLLKFGIPYQINQFLATLKDDGITLILGAVLGPVGIGILGTAQKLAQYPLRFFMDNVTRVTFPAFSRMQDKKLDLAKAVTRSIFFITFFVYPSIVGLVILTPVIIQVVPRYAKWEPALIPLALISINTVFAAATTQLTNLLNAIGRIKTTFKLMIMWTSLTWILVPVLAVKFGVNGAAAGYALVASSSVVAIYIAHKVVNFSLYEVVVKPGLGTLIMGTVLFIVRRGLPTSLLSVWILGVLGGVAYFASMYILVGSSIIADAKKGIKAIFSR